MQSLREVAPVWQGIVYLCASAHHNNSPTITFFITTFSGGSGLQNRLQIQNPWTFLRFLHILVTQCVQYCECNWLLNQCVVNITATLSHLAQRYTTAVKRELLPARTVLRKTERAHANNSPSQQRHFNTGHRTVNNNTGYTTMNTLPSNTTCIRQYTNMAVIQCASPPVTLALHCAAYLPQNSTKLPLNFDSNLLKLSTVHSHTHRTQRRPNADITR